MKKLFLGACMVFLALAGVVYADAAPPVPGVRLARELGPIPIVVIGIALSLAVAVGGISAARAKRSRRIALATIIGVPVMLMVTLLYVGLSVPRRPPGPPPLRILADTDPFRVMIVAELPAAELKNLPAGVWTQDQGETWLRFAVVKKDGTGLPMLGFYERHNDHLIFKPRYALESGVLYRTSFGTNPAKEVSADYQVPAREPTAPATVVKILPGGDVLPANHLKFYIYFSAPMRGGRDIFDQICILDADGTEVRDPWLRDELWDENDQMLIIYIHPGRIKWGLLLREMLGPVLLLDKEYSFVVRGTMLDAHGQKLGKDHVKRFRTTAEERTRVPVADWKLQSPAAGTRQPLKIDLPRVIDHTCLQKHLAVKDARGQIVAGAVAVEKAGKAWSFTPQDPWRAEEHGLYVDPRLEDVAGNTPVRPFDVDLKAPVPAPQALEINFRPN